MTICYVAPLQRPAIQHPCYERCDIATLLYSTPADMYLAISESGAGKVVQIGLHSWPPPSDSFSDPDAIGRIEASSSFSDTETVTEDPPYCSSPLATMAEAFLVSSARSGHGRKPQVPSSGLAIQVDTELSVVDACQCLECLVQNLSVLVWTRSSLV